MVVSFDLKAGIGRWRSELEGMDQGLNRLGSYSDLRYVLGPLVDFIFYFVNRYVSFC